MGNWLIRLCNEMIGRKINEEVVFDCNFWFDYIICKNVLLMRKVNFRKLLIGVEFVSE